MVLKWKNACSLSETASLMSGTSSEAAEGVNI